MDVKVLVVSRGVLVGQGEKLFSSKMRFSFWSTVKADFDLKFRIKNFEIVSDKADLVWKCVSVNTVSWILGLLGCWIVISVVWWVYPKCRSWILHTSLNQVSESCLTVCWSKPSMKGAHASWIFSCQNRRFVLKYRLRFICFMLHCTCLISKYSFEFFINLSSKVKCETIYGDRTLPHTYIRRPVDSKNPWGTQLVIETLVRGAADAEYCAQTWCVTSHFAQW